MSFLILGRTVKFHPPASVDVVLLPFHISWHLWLRGLDAAARNFYIWVDAQETREERGLLVFCLFLIICFKGTSSPVFCVCVCVLGNSLFPDRRKTCHKQRAFTEESVQTKGGEWMWAPFKGCANVG